MKMSKTNRTINSCLATVILFTSQIITAQGGLVGKIDGWKDDIKEALDAAVVVFAIVGGFIIFIQYMQGNEQAQKNFIKFVIGLAIFGLVDLIANVFV